MQSNPIQKDISRGSCAYKSSSPTHTGSSKDTNY